MHLRKLALLAALSVTGAFVACTLNPQPLPPSDNEATFGDASARSDGGAAFTPGPETPPTQDASPPPLNDGEAGGGGDGGDAGDDGGDGGDGGDAGADADSG